MLENREFNVELVVTQVHNYVVTARTEEAAIDEAEQLFKSGDLGEVSEVDMQASDAYPIEDEEFDDTDAL